MVVEASLRDGREGGLGMVHKSRALVVGCMRVRLHECRVIHLDLVSITESRGG